MSRLILVPQMPVKMRYQDWWFNTLPEKFIHSYDEVVRIGSFLEDKASDGTFGTIALAAQYEALQIREYMELELRTDDTLLLCDLSYPGLFASALLLKRPKNCYAICHATSLNTLDLFEPIREMKWPIESAHAAIFRKVFVGSEYHKKKLGWPNTVVSGMPLPPQNLIAQALTNTDIPKRYHEYVCVSRSTKQKRNIGLEITFGKRVRHSVHGVPTFSSWTDYYSNLRKYKFMIITSREETFGYQVIDALKMGVIPIAPNAFSYPELLPPTFLYEPGNVDSLVDTVEKIRENYETNQRNMVIPEDKFFEIVMDAMTRGV